MDASATERLRAESSGSSAVDREKNVISGVVIAELGPFKTPGRGQFSQVSLEKIVELGNKQRHGLKSRFTHPDLSSDGLGKFVGRAKNFRLDDSGEKLAVRADLHISKTAMKPPPEGGGTPYGEYVLSLAEEDPHAFSTSLVLEADRDFQIDKEGNQKRDANGNLMPPTWIPKKLFATDIVDTGDAVDDFLSFQDFSVDGLPDSAVRQTAATLDSLFSGVSREEVESRCQAFLSRYLSRQFGEDPMSETNNDSAILEQLSALGDAQAKSSEAIVVCLKEVSASLKELKEESAPKGPTPEELAAEELKKAEALCAMANFSEEQSEALLKMYRGDILSMDDLKAEVRKKMLADNAPTSGDGGGETAKQLKEKRREYQEHRDIHEALGLSEEDFLSIDVDSPEPDYFKDAHRNSLKAFEAGEVVGDTPALFF